MRHLTTISLSIAASFSLQADSIPISASRSAEAAATITIGGSSVNPGADTEAVYPHLGSHFSMADARAGVWSPPIGHPFAVASGGGSSIGVDGIGSLDGVSGNLRAGVFVNDAGVGGVYDGDASLRIFYRFELATPHSFIFASTRSDTLPGAAINWSYDSSFELRKDGGPTTTWDTDVNQFVTGVLEPGFYEVEYNNHIESGGTYASALTGLVTVESRFALILEEADGAAVPDEGSLWPFLFLVPAGAMLIKRKKV
jgi:hypothetical protein